MQGPSEELRIEVGERARGLRRLDDDTAESGLEELLSLIESELHDDLAEHPPEDDDPRLVVAAIGAWTSVISYALAEVYAPQSPMPRRKAGFSKDKALAKLEGISALLRRPLASVQRRMSAESYSISVGFPWGISVGLSWS